MRIDDTGPWIETDPVYGAIAILPGAWIHPPIVLAATPSRSAWSPFPHSSSLPWPPTHGPHRIELTTVDETAGLKARLEVEAGSRPGPLRLRWSLAWSSVCTAAVQLPMTLDVRDPSGNALLVPGIHYGWEATRARESAPGYGLYPRLDPARGFSIRADRLPQVALVAGSDAGSWALFSPAESPTPALPGAVYSIWGCTDADGRMRVGIRYPQAEHGHSPGSDGLAYLAKGVVGHGEDRRHLWRPGDRLTIRLGLWKLQGAPSIHAGTVARRMWQLKRVAWRGNRQPVEEARSRIHWIDRHLWCEEIGQYESPEGSETAMAGFVEMSLATACVVARLGLADQRMGLGRTPGNPARTAGPVDHALYALDTWLTDGVTTDGVLVPVRDSSGFRFGRRCYETDLRISSEAVVESIRPTAECRSVLGLLRQAGPTVLGADRWTKWRRALVTTAQWLERQRVDGVLPAVLRVDGQQAAGDDLGSGSLVSLLCDLSLDEPDARVAAALLSRAADAYRLSVAPRARRRRFGGVTLDAACPDREAVIAALDASLGMYEATDDPDYLRDAAAAVDVLLSYVFAYRIGTFCQVTDARERDISTLGASLVSPENQHLDPFPVGPSLIKFGLYAKDRTALTAGAANTAWCLDGRWALHGADGTKQPEQFGHTAWHYDAYFTQRGDFRRGMPRFGLADSEHGWPQALPLQGLFELGHVVVDWPSKRIASLPGVRVRACHTDSGFRIDLAREDGTQEALEAPMLMRILRPPRQASMTLIAGGSTYVVSWPSTLATVIIDRSSPTVEVRVLDD